MSTQAGNKVNLSMSVSADGSVAGPSQAAAHPPGVGGAPDRDGRASQHVRKLRSARAASNASAIDPSSSVPPWERSLPCADCVRLSVSSC